MFCLLSFVVSALTLPSIAPGSWAVTPQNLTLTVQSTALNDTFSLHLSTLNTEFTLVLNESFTLFGPVGDLHPITFSEVNGHPSASGLLNDYLYRFVIFDGEHAGLTLAKNGKLQSYAFSRQQTAVVRSPVKEYGPYAFLGGIFAISQLCIFVAKQQSAAEASKEASDPKKRSPSEKSRPRKASPSKTKRD
jgi:hypothetical protein